MRDLEDVETELILSDLVVVEKRLERLDKDRKKIKNPELDREFELLERCRKTLEDDQPLRNLEIRRARTKSAFAASSFFRRSRALRAESGRRGSRRSCTSARSEYRDGPLAGRRNTAVTAVCGKIEAELAELPREDQRRLPGQLRTEGIRPRAPDLRHLFAARPDEFSHRRRRRMPRLDHPHEQHRGESRRRHSLRFRKEVHSRRSGELEERWWIWEDIPACAKKACCASKARNTL